MNTIPIISCHRAPTFDDLNSDGGIIDSDWYGRKISTMVRYLFWVNTSHFYFLAGEDGRPGRPHPESHPGEYRAELWKHDVAEFFLMSADRTRYLEFNLAPNGAWWTSAFTGPREPARGEPTPVPGVEVIAEQTARSWRAIASFPLSWLQAHYGLGERTTLNATFILHSPDQIFLTVAHPGEGEPDFHRPAAFPGIKESPGRDIFGNHQ